MADSFIIGIDLGTTNCALAFARPTPGSAGAVHDFAISQLQRPGQIGEQALLPSSLYVPAEYELAPGSAQLPWGESPKLIAGEFARWQGARVPGRLVASAKSWLCHPGVDRSAPILPWGAPAEVTKVSPTGASALLLSHLAAAWNFAHPEAPMADQDVVITVPASFDEVARALTVNAARQAGLEKFTLVEEPLAAFYDFTSHHRHKLTAALAGVRLVLVADVGGGTTDFTLIEASVSEEGPVLRRIAVGDHLMLGGDNMDAALARRAEERLVAGGKKLSATQWTQLVQATRVAKEALLSRTPAERHGIALAGEGSRLLGGTLSTELTRDEAEKVTLEGFFPACGPDERPRRVARVALQELGLPYASDPAITRHLAAFLSQHANAAFAALDQTTTRSPAAAPVSARSGLPRPDAILLNGGVFNSPRITEQLLNAVSAWWPDAPPVQVLPYDSLELAVARGAACYGLVRRGLGQRIGGGAAHAFYIGLGADKESSAPRAVCVIPRGHEEGQTIDLTARPFTLMLNQPVQFPLLSTTSDRVDLPGSVVEVGEDFRTLLPIHTLLRSAQSKATTLPVHLQATLTELGTLELWCVAQETKERWRLEFELRGSTASAEPTVTESMPPEFVQVREVFDRVFGAKPLPIPAKDVRQLARTLEQAIGPREEWGLPLLREVWGGLFAGAARRRRSPDHERIFFHLVGFGLRPGFGYPLDEWRCEQTFKLFAEGVHAHAEPAVWNEFWVLWRRIAGGLGDEPQNVIWSYLKPHLIRQVPPHPPKNAPRPKGVQPQGLEEMVRTAASLEHLEPAEKIVLGTWIAERLRTPGKQAGPWAWALGRLGARMPLHGSSHKTVDTEQASDWLSLLLELGLNKIEGAPFAAAQLARRTGDRTRDLDDALRARTVAALTTAGAPERWLQMVSQVVVLEAADEARALGDTLPLGLKLR